MMKKRIAALLAIAMTLPLFPVVSMAADPTPSADKPEVTVVGKRITDGDPYFEISLEVNGEYKDYSSVGVVLEYDPKVIVPAASWDEGAGQADMKDNNSWATRRALPTLGKDTWSSHIALAYQTETKGYLYLGAEYPGETPSTAEPSSGDSGSGDGDGGETPADAETPADPYTNPVVVARFMYAAPTTYGDATKTAEDVATERAATKAALETAWTTAWDDDWTKNTILTIAPDDVALESPAQFPFAYYGADFSERAYMKTFPTPAPTAAAVTASPAAVHTVFASGSRIAEADRLTKDNIEIVLGQGASAKTSGGLKLSDIYLILFYDWDDTLLGTMTAGVGLDMTEDVDNFVESNFIHPDLRRKKADGSDNLDYQDIINNGEQIQRKYSYRGEYPYDKPDSEFLFLPGGNKVVNNGADYPLTNKLDYTFAGKTLNPEHPFANGWVQVTPTEINYDPDELYDPECSYIRSQPKSISNTWTALEDDNIEYMSSEEFDESGEFVDTDAYVPEAIACDFSKITKEKLNNSNNNLYVKAAYAPCEYLNYLGEDVDDYLNNYTILTPLKYTALGYITEEAANYSISYDYGRVNEAGYGVTRAKEPAVRTDVLPVGGEGTFINQINIDNTDRFKVTVLASRAVQSINYVLEEIDQLTIADGNQISYQDEERDWDNYGTLFLESEEQPHQGFKVDCSLGYLVKLVLNSETGSIDTVVLNDLDVKRNTDGADYTSRYVTNAVRTRIENFILEAMEQSGGEVPVINYYQLQWALLNNSEFVAPDEAQQKCVDAGYDWCEPW